MVAHSFSFHSLFLLSTLCFSSVLVLSIVSAAAAPFSRFATASSSAAAAASSIRGGGSDSSNRGRDDSVLPPPPPFPVWTGPSSFTNNGRDFTTDARRCEEAMLRDNRPQPSSFPERVPPLVPPSHGASIPANRNDSSNNSLIILHLVHLGRSLDRLENTVKEHGNQIKKLGFQIGISLAFDFLIGCFILHFLYSIYWRWR